MRKKKTLYTVNRWNRPLFMPEENVFLSGGAVLAADRLASQKWGADYGDTGKTLDDYMGSTNTFGISKADNPFSKMNIQGGLGAMAKTPVGGGLLSAGAGIVGGLANSAISGGLSSKAGSAISGIGSTVGSAVGAVNPLLGAAVTVGSGILGGVTNALFGESVNEKALQEANEGTAKLNSFRSSASSFDDIKGPEAVANVADDIYEGGLFNDVSGKNEELKRQRAEARMFADRSILNNVSNLAADQLNNALATYAAFGGPIETIGDDNMGAIGYGFMSDYLASKKKQAEQKEKMSNMFMNTPSLFADGGGLNRDKDYKSEKKPYPSVKKGDFAGGGRSYPIPTKADAIDALRLAGLHHRPDVKAKVYRKYPELKHADGGSLNLLYQDNTPLFAFGGDMQTNGADYGTGLTHVSAGGSHEENPYDGVQMGVDPNGTPNLVEENETVWNDYVFSARIPVDQTIKEKFHLPKKKEMTYAEVSKKLEKEIAEHPNDPISQAGFNAQMQTLAEEQERQKQEMEAERAKAAFEALSPEEQVAVMENAAQQEQMAQQAAMQEQAMAQQQAQPSPEEQAIMQQQMMQADGSQAMVGQESQMNCFGGKINRFDLGGPLLNALGFHTKSEYTKWLKENGIEYSDEDESILYGDNGANHDKWLKAISKKNPALGDAMTRGYNFGAYTPNNTDNVTFKDISRGNWAAQDYEGWKDSQDPAWLEAVKKGLVKEGMEQEDIAKALRQTDNYKRGSKWLQDSEDNRLRYLRTILEDENSPEVAKNYARKFIDANGWKKDAARDYESIFGANGKGVRETHPGTYWHTPIEAVRGAQTGNFVINDDGTVEPIIGDVPTDWTGAGNYSWATPENDYAYNYYRRPAAVADAAKTPEQKVVEAAKAKEEARRIVPIHTNPIFGIEDVGPLVSMGLMAAKVGKPDTGSLFSAVRGAGDVTLADWMPRGDFAVYRPDDPWFYTSPIIAQSNATQRAIGNKVSPAKGAETLANSYNTMTALGQAQRQQLDSNFDKYMKVKQYNGTIYDANQKEYGQTSRFNANARNDAAGRQAQLGLTAAREAMDANAAFDQNWYGNIGALTKAIGARRKENRTRNMIADMAATGILGNMNPDTFIANGMLRYETDEERRKRLSQPAAEGGKIKRKKSKRGLTI